jgi:hypothetical protein
MVKNRLILELVVKDDSINYHIEVQTDDSHKQESDELIAEQTLQWLIGYSKELGNFIRVFIEKNNSDYIELLNGDTIK